MADRIGLQKLGFAFAPAQKIVALKREDRDADKRRFERQLSEESERNEEDTIDIDADVHALAGKEGQPEKTAEERRRDKEREADGMAPPGSVVDLHV